MATRSQSLRLYRHLLQARHNFPVDAKRAETGHDMQTILYNKIRDRCSQACMFHDYASEVLQYSDFQPACRFDAQRSVTDQYEISRLVEHGKEELGCVRIHCILLRMAMASMKNVLPDVARSRFRFLQRLEAFVWQSLSQTGATILLPDLCL